MCFAIYFWCVCPHVSASFTPIRPSQLLDGRGIGPVEEAPVEGEDAVVADLRQMGRSQCFLRWTITVVS